MARSLEVGDRVRARTSKVVRVGTLGRVYDTLVQTLDMYFVLFDGEKRVRLMHESELERVTDAPADADASQATLRKIQENDMYPFSVDDSRERSQVRLDEAEEWRQATRATANRVSCVDHLRIRVGAQLISLGQFVKAAGLSESQFDEAPPA